MKQILFSLILLLPVLAVRSQPVSESNDTTETKINVPTIVRFTNPETDMSGLLRYEKLDTTLDDIQVVNPAIKYFYNDLSNTGSAADRKLFHHHTSALTHLGNSTYDLYKWKPEGIRYYKTNKRFSEITYHQGGGKEQVVKITFAQNILKNWNTGVDFRRLGTLGFLTKGITFHSNFDAFTWYHTPNNRYQLFASAIWNRIKNQVNGGLTTDSLVDASNFSNSELAGVSVNLNDGTQHWRNNTFSLNHFFDFGNRKNSGEDSTSYLPVFRIRHDAIFESSSYVYAETAADSNFYQHYYFGATTLDSLHYRQFKNKVSLANFIRLNKDALISSINYQFGGGYQWFQYHQILERTFTNTFLEARGGGTSNDEQLFVTAGGQYIFDGENEKSYTYDASLQIPLLDLVKLKAGVEQKSHAPSLMQSLYISNHFIWENDFRNIQSSTLKAAVEIAKYKFEIGIQNNSVSNYVFFDSSSVPAQNAESVRTLQAYLTKNFHFGKFRFKNTVWWQSASDDKIIHLPEILSHHSLFFESWLFKQKLFTQIGFDAHYASGYYSNAYNPAVSVFYLQNEIKTNEYPLVDLFVNFKIKTAKVFLKLQNIGDDLVKNGYYQTPHYPMPGRIFQLGVNWRFFD